MSIEITRTYLPATFSTRILYGLWPSGCGDYDGQKEKEKREKGILLAYSYSYFARWFLENLIRYTRVPRSVQKYCRGCERIESQPPKSDRFLCKYRGIIRAAPVRRGARFISAFQKSRKYRFLCQSKLTFPR